MPVNFPIPPTFADPVIYDENTKKQQFNPLWLRWFLDLAQAIVTPAQHNSLDGLQGGDATSSQYYHLTKTIYDILKNLGTPTAGGVAYGTGATVSFTPAGTAGQVLTSNGVGAPTWNSYLYNISYIDLNTGATVTPAVGRLWWDGGSTLNIGMTSTVTGKVMENTYFYVKASSAITIGQVVMFTGSVGASGVLKAAPATGVTDGSYIMGIAAESIALNGFGLIQFNGTLKGFNTSMFADGDILWYDPTVVGGLTKTKPSAPNVKVQVGAVINAGSGASGSVQIRVTAGSVLGGTDSNVEFGTLANGDLIQYDSVAQYWTNVTPASVIAGAGGAPVTKTANFSVAAGETWLINNKSGSSCTVTLPTASTNTGRVLHFQNYQAQTLVSASSNVVPLAGGSAGTAILAAVAGDTCTLVSDGTNWLMTQYTPNNVLLLE